MTYRSNILAASLALAFAGAIAISGNVDAASMSAAQAEATLVQSGYRNISMLELRDGAWMATATNPEGVLVDVHVDPNDARVLASPAAKTTVTTTTTTRPGVPASTVVERVVEQPTVRAPIIVQERILVPAGGKISKDDVRAVLAGAGYTDIHDIDWLDGRAVWKAEARDATGDDREIHVDPIDARIVHVEND